MRIPKSSLLLKIFSTTLFRGAGAVATLMLTLVITRNLTASEAGVLLFCIAMITVTGQILSVGCHLSSIKLLGSNLYAKNWSAINTDISGMNVIIILISIPLLMSVALLSNDINYLLIILGGLAFSLLQLYCGALIGAGRHQLATLFLNGAVPFIAILGILGILQAYPTSSNNLLASAYALSSWIALFIILGIWYRQDNAHFIPKAIVSSTTSSHLKSTYPIVLAQLSTQYASQFATAMYLADAEFAYFSSALRTSLLVSFMLMAANLVVASKFAEFYEKKETKAIDSLARLTSRILVLIAAPLCIALILFSKQIMNIFGESYVYGAAALAIMVAGQFVNVATGSTSILLSMCGGEKTLRKCMGITFVVAVCSSFLLTFLYGITGAAAATALSVATQNLLAAYYTKSHLGFNPLNIFRKI